MSNIISIEKNIPYCCIVGPKNEPHIVPLQVIERIANGTLPLRMKGQEESDDDMIRGIIMDWLKII